MNRNTYKYKEKIFYLDKITSITDVYLKTVCENRLEICFQWKFQANFCGQKLVISRPFKLIKYVCEGFFRFKKTYDYFNYQQLLAMKRTSLSYNEYCFLFAQNTNSTKEYNYVFGQFKKLKKKLQSFENIWKLEGTREG